MANHFNITNLGDITVFIKDGTHGTHKDVLDGPFLLSAQNVINGEIVINKEDRKISVDDFNAIHRRYKLRNNDVLVSIVGTLGKCALIKDYHSDYTFQRSVAIIRFDTKKILPKFAYYQMLGDNFQRELRRRESKGAQGGVYLGELEKIPLDVPDLETQQKIVGILEMTASLCKLYIKQSEIETQKLKALKYELFYNTDKAGDFVKLKDLFVFKTGYTPSKSNAKYWDYGTIPWFRMEDIRKKGRILGDSIQHVTRAAIKGRLFPANSIIMSTTATIGEYALLTSDSLANQRFTFLTRKVNCCKRIDITYFYHYCSILSEWCKRNVNSGGLLAVDMKAFENYKMKLPAIDEQAKIAKILSMQEQKIDLLNKMAKCARKQHKYLLNHLINGDFDLSKIQLEEKDKSC